MGRARRRYKMLLHRGCPYEAWCHQRDYVCFIQEIGEHHVKAGEWLGAVHLVGYFDSIEAMEQTYDLYRGATSLSYTTEGWNVVR